MRKMKHINFKHNKPHHTYPGPSASSLEDFTTCPQLFKNHVDYISHTDSSVKAPLPRLQSNWPLQLSYRADVDISQAGSSQHDSILTTLCHTEHSTTLTCKCLHSVLWSIHQMFPCTSDNIDGRNQDPKCFTVMAYYARKLPVTASTAKRVPKRKTKEVSKWAHVPNLYWKYSNKACQWKWGQHHHTDGELKACSGDERPDGAPWPSLFRSQPRCDPQFSTATWDQVLLQEFVIPGNSW